MGFINALVDVSKNQKQFKEWEKQEADKKEQRKALAQKRHLDKATLDKAAAKGKVIMDVVDIMDTHSEEVAENVEEVVIPNVSLIPVLGILGSLYGALFASEKMSNDRYIANRKFLYESAEGEKLINIGNNIRTLRESLGENASEELKKLKLSRATDLFENKKNVKIFKETTDETLKAYWNQIEELSKKYYDFPGIKGYSGKMKGMWSAAALAAGVLFVGINVLGAKLQVKSSRIARWQSRQDLNDPKYFVQYTPEQIAQAKANLENQKQEQNKEKTIPFRGLVRKNQEKNPGFIESITDVMKDNKNYNEWKSNYNLEDKKVTRQLTQEEIEEAQRDKELIQRITKQINNKAEDYGENMEVAASVLIGGTPVLGAAVGFVIKKIGDLFKINEKIQNNSSKKFFATIEEYISKLDDQSAKKAREIMENVVLTTVKDNKEVKKINTKYLLEKADDVMELLEQVFKNSKQGSMGGFVLKNLGAIFNGITSTSKGTAAVFAIVGSIVTGIAGSIIGLKLQKSASRAGRFKAKQELQNDPQNFIGYTEKDYESMKDIKAKKPSLMKRLGEYVMFIPRCIGDYYKYDKYKKQEGKDNKALLKELVKLDVSDEQMKEAKDLQRKVFTTFESVDDKSQEYSESMETANEMMKPFLPYIGLLVTSIPIVGSVVLAFRKGGANFTQKITGFIAKHTGVLKSKPVSKYFDNIGENLRTVVQKQNSTIAENVTKKEAARQMLEKLLLQHEEKIPPIPKEELRATVCKLLGSHLDEASEVLIDELLKDCNTIHDVLHKILTKENFDALVPDNIDSSVIIEKAKILLTQFADPAKKLAGGLNQTVRGAIGSGNWRKFANDENIPNRLRKMIKYLDGTKMTDEQALQIYANLETIIKNIPSEQLNKIMNIALDEFQKNPEKFIKAVKSGQLKTIVATNDIMAGVAIATGTWSALSLLITYVLESVFADMQKKAGRLGVMQGLNELNDERYYANEETFTSNEISKEQVVTINASPMLRKQIEKNGQSV